MELQQLRTARGLKLSTVGTELGWSKSKAGHFETEERLPSYEDLEKLTSLYRAPEGRLEVLWQRVGIAQRPGWWEDQGSPDQYGPANFGRFVGLEQGAEQLLIWEPFVVSGLLQTQDYAWAIIRALSPDQPEVVIDDRTALRMRRQAVFDVARVHVVLGEGALRLLVADPAVMRSQLSRLEELLGHPNITIQVLPYSTGPHPGLHGPFTVMAFPDDPQLADPGVVYHEGLLRASWYDTYQEVKRYTETFAELADRADKPDHTAATIHKVIKELSQ